MTQQKEARWCGNITGPLFVRLAFGGGVASDAR
jgi:hypothetical protein